VTDGHVPPPASAAPAPPIAPSGRQLALATLAAVAAAALVLTVAVLPAEYGIDPIGAGAAIGLMPPAEPAALPDPHSSSGPVLSPAPMGPVSYYGAPFATDHVEFELGPYEYVEYKYRLAQGASVQFAWVASARVLHDLHADRDGAEGHEGVSFDRQERARAFGTHTAPFSGMHGWLWENPGSETVTVSLTSSGFFGSATEYRSNGTRMTREIPGVLK
jgi:hypothetical protein